MLYNKPVVLPSTDLAEGIYAASGTTLTCYTTTARIHQKPEVGRGDYRIQVDAHHHGDHTKESQRLVIRFNQPVIYKSSPGQIAGGDGTDTLTIALRYHQNPNDNIGFGDLTVESFNGLVILNAEMYD